MLRVETRARARALQALYAMEIGPGATLAEALEGLARLTGPDPAVYDQAEDLARSVLAEQGELDRQAEGAAEHWRLDRIAAVERNILRIGVYELRAGRVPPKVAIDEAVQLAHWFGGAKAPAFVNGVLDHVARAMGRL